jgi:hypothetical protein
MYADCQAARGCGSSSYPVMTRAEMPASLDLLPAWALEQKAAANRQVIAVMRRRLAAGEQVARMHQERGLIWLERRAEGRRGAGRRAPRCSQAPPLMWFWPTAASAVKPARVPTCPLRHPACMGSSRVNAPVEPRRVVGHGRCEAWFWQRAGKTLARTCTTRLEMRPVLVSLPNRGAGVILATWQQMRRRVSRACSWALA